MYEEKVRKFTCYYCSDCKLYAGSETKTIHGRRMKPNTKYCTGGKKVIIFRSDDPKVNVPKWCPKRRMPPVLRIYHFRSVEIELGESMLAANGISFFPYPSRYAVRYEGDSPYTGNRRWHPPILFPCRASRSRAVHPLQKRHCTRKQVR